MIMNTIIVIGIVLTVAPTAVIIYLDTKCIENNVLSFVCGFISCLGAAMLSTRQNTPTAMDVYREKTTLEITYRDSVAIDSTVVYKDYYKQ